MKLKLATVSAFAAAALGAVIGTVPGLETLGWTENDITFAVQETTRYDGTWGPASKLLKGATMRAVKALDSTARVQLVKTSAPIVKIIVMSPAFLSAHDKWIAQQFDAVDHKVSLTETKAAAKDVDAMMRDMQRQLAAQMYATYSQMPVATIQQMLAQELPQWQENLKGADAESRARYQKLIARARQIQPLAASDPAAFQRAYGVLKSIEQGGPDNEAQLAAAGDDTRKQQQQRNYAQYNLRAILKKRLNEFVKVASTVDFAAQTTTVGNKVRFADAANERKAYEWKLLYRFGQAPTQAAVAVAQQWAKEL